MKVMNVSFEDMKCVIRISLIFNTNGIYKKCGLSEFDKIHFPKRGGVWGVESEDDNELSVTQLRGIQIRRVFRISGQTMRCYITRLLSEKFHIYTLYRELYE